MSSRSRTAHFTACLPVLFNNIVLLLIIIATTLTGTASVHVDYNGKQEQSDVVTQCCADPVLSFRLQQFAGPCACISLHQQWHRYKDWIFQSGGYIHPHTELKYMDAHHFERGVFVVEDNITAGEILMQIPLTASFTSYLVSKYVHAPLPLPMPVNQTSRKFDQFYDRAELTEAERMPKEFPDFDAYAQHCMATDAQRISRAMHARSWSSLGMAWLQKYTNELLPWLALLTDTQYLPLMWDTAKRERLFANTSLIQIARASLTAMPCASQYFDALGISEHEFKAALTQMNSRCFGFLGNDAYVPSGFDFLNHNLSNNDLGHLHDVDFGYFVDNETTHVWHKPSAYISVVLHTQKYNTSKPTGVDYSSVSHILRQQQQQRQQQRERSNKNGSDRGDDDGDGDGDGDGDSGQDRNRTRIREGALASVYPDTDFASFYAIAMHDKRVGEEVYNSYGEHASYKTSLHYAFVENITHDYVRIDSSDMRSDANTHFKSEYHYTYTASAALAAAAKSAASKNAEEAEETEEAHSVDSRKWEAIGNSQLAAVNRAAPPAPRPSAGVGANASESGRKQLMRFAMKYRGEPMLRIASSAQTQFRFFFLPMKHFDSFTMSSIWNNFERRYLHSVVDPAVLRAFKTVCSSPLRAAATSLATDEAQLFEVEKARTAALSWLSRKSGHLRAWPTAQQKTEKLQELQEWGDLSLALRYRVREKTFYEQCLNVSAVELIISIEADEIQAIVDAYEVRFDDDEGIEDDEGDGDSNVQHKDKNETTTTTTTTTMDTVIVRTLGWNSPIASYANMMDAKTAKLNFRPWSSKAMAMPKFVSCQELDSRVSAGVNLFGVDADDQVLLFDYGERTQGIERYASFRNTFQKLQPRRPRAGVYYE